mgnify:FL=1
MGASTLPLLAAIAIGYLLGSIPFGLLLTKAAGLGDIRNVGSGNIGATNVLRTGNKGLAAATLLLDAVKGTLAVHAGWFLGAWLLAGRIAWERAHGTSGAALAMLIGSEDNLLAFAAAGGLGAFIGHLYPVWLGFKGGKGVATYIGVLIGLLWQAAATFCAIWLLVAVATRYSSLSALAASIATPLVVWLLGKPTLAMMLVPLSVLLIYKHGANIGRLMNGEEPKIGAKS